jgi:LmbE family N-acetylglucosaminyl deacetylase
VLQLSLDKAKNLLFLGAHADDIEIGCGGTILTLVQENPDRDILWVVFSAKGKRRAEARSSAKLFLNGVRRSKVVTKQFRTSFFPVEQDSIKTYFETLKNSFRPDIVFTHYRDDRHQDHRILSDLAWNTFRDHMILEYEVPKYDGDLGSPNLFVPLQPAVAQRKAKGVQNNFPTQRGKHWFSEETFLALMRLRGMECATRYAEAYYCRKLICG